MSAAIFRDTGIPIESTGGAGSVTCLASTSVGVFPSNGSRPVIAKNAVAPSEYRSLRPSTSWPNACSGLMNSGVPDTPSPVASLLTAAIPKSATITRPVPTSSRMLSGFTSRWTRPCEWAWASAQAASRNTRAPSALGSGPRVRTRSASVCPSTYAIT